MSFPRDILMIVVCAVLLGLDLTSWHFLERYAVIPLLAPPYRWLSEDPVRGSGLVSAAFGAFLTFLLTYVVSWGVTTIGRLPIQLWGEAGGPSIPLPFTWLAALISLPFYAVAWWLCPINHRPVSNIAYSLNLMRLWPLTIPIVLIAALIPGAVFSGHYRDVLIKILFNYPYRDEDAPWWKFW